MIERGGGDLRDTTHSYSVNHGLWYIPGRIRHLLGHVHDHVEADERKGRLEESEEPRHPIRPASSIVESSEDELSGRLWHDESQEENADEDDSDDRPEYYECQR